MARRLALILILTLLAAPLAAQRFTASIRGTVTDPNGDALPGATVNLEGTETGLNRTTFTNPAGIYTFGDLPVGAYEVTVTLDGFNAAVVTDIALHVADVREVNAQLELGRRLGDDHGRSRGNPRRHAERRGLRPDQRRADPRAAAQRTQLRPAHPPAAGRQRSRRFRHEEQGPAGRRRPVHQRQRHDRQPVDDRRREQQRRRLEPHDPDLPLGRRHRGVQDPQQQLQRRGSAAPPAARSTS